MAKIGPNERCPCGSGKKFKKCCRDARSIHTYSAADRASALAKLDVYADVFAESDREDAAEEFWGRYLDQAAEMPDDLALQSDMIRGADLGAFYKTLAPFFHDVWAGAFLAPHVPELKTTDGEDVIPTSTRFDVLDVAALSRALDGHAELERDGDGDGDGWLWSGNNQHGKPILLGHITRHGDRLELRTQSVERGDRGRALLEAAGGDALRHRITSHENLQRAVKDRLRDRYLGGATAQHSGPRAKPSCRTALARR